MIHGCGMELRPERKSARESLRQTKEFIPGGHMAGSVAIAAENIDAAVAHVEEAKRENVDLIKLMITGGVLEAKEKGVPGELKIRFGNTSL